MFALSLRVRCLASFAFVMLAAVAVTRVAVACDTPVYRYAMYRWQPAPYEVYYFHNQTPVELHDKVQEQIEALARNDLIRTNVVYLPVDLKEDPQLVAVPADVKKSWQAHENQPVPSYMVVSPMGAEIFTGDMLEDDVKSLVDSPLRQKIAKELELGKATVLVLLGGNDKEANAAAEGELKQLIGDVASGKIELYSGPPGGLFTPEEEKADDEKKQPPHEISYVKLDRDDEKEKWLTRMLLAVEPDLKEEQFASQPMVFAVYGRGRVLPPYIGKGVTRDNLIDLAQYVTGACSCTVKEQNPGVDLLTRYDWESASAAVAEKFGTEEGNERQLGVDSFFPELIVGPAVPDKPTSPTSTDANANNTQASDNTAETATSTADSTTDPAQTEPKQDDTATRKPSDSTADKTSSGSKNEKKLTSTDGEKLVAVAEPASSSSAQPKTSDANRYLKYVMWPIVIGVAVVLFVLMGATLVLVRRR